jgi:hypothetical protein
MGLAEDEYGALEVDVEPGRLTQAELESLVSADGLEIASLDDLEILEDSTLSYKDRRVILYIRDHAMYAGGGESRTIDPKFHVANCDTLDTMRASKRFARYVVAAKADGTFNINIKQGEKTRTELRKLSVCQNCLNALKYDCLERGMLQSQRAKIVSGFQLEKFFEIYPRSLHKELPKFTSDDAPLNDYEQDFSQVSNAVRAASGWTCQNPRCSKKLFEQGLRKYLHVHHINGVKSDSAPKNLRVLCIKCHAEEPNHGHMKNMPDYKAFVALRK